MGICGLNIELLNQLNASSGKEEYRTRGMELDGKINEQLAIYLSNLRRNLSNE